MGIDPALIDRAKAPTQHSVPERGFPTWRAIRQGVGAKTARRLIRMTDLVQCAPLASTSRSPSPTADWLRTWRRLSHGQSDYPRRLGRIVLGWRVAPMRSCSDMRTTVRNSRNRSPIPFKPPECGHYRSRPPWAVDGSQKWCAIPRSSP